MAVKSDKNLSQSYIVERAKKVLKLSEDKLIQVLEGKTKLPEKVVVNVALELYKRRIPQLAETNKERSQLAIIHIHKNHIPGTQGEIIDITAESKELDEATDAKIRAINKKIEDNVNTLHVQQNKPKPTEEAK